MNPEIFENKSLISLARFLRGEKEEAITVNTYYDLMNIKFTAGQLVVFRFPERGIMLPPEGGSLAYPLLSLMGILEVKKMMVIS